MQPIFNAVHNIDARRIQLQYLHAFNRPLFELAPIREISNEMHMHIADAYEAMTDEPLAPEVKAAYKALVLETKLQFIYIQNAGYSIELYFEGGEPYANSADMLTDVIHNKHLYVLPTSSDFGTDGITQEMRELSLMVQPSGQFDACGVPMLNNDLFRAVHDFFGHTVMGNSFGPIGEENAWREHYKMYSPEARRAMTTETRGQNSWVNFGTHMRNTFGNIRTKNEKGFIPASQRPFAPQKLGLLPDWCADLY